MRARLYSNTQYTLSLLHEGPLNPHTTNVPTPHLVNRWKRNYVLDTPGKASVGEFPDGVLGTRSFKNPTLNHVQLALMPSLGVVDSYN